MIGQLNPPSGFDWDSATLTVLDVLGGVIEDGEYIPNHTYDETNPWNPDHPFGGLDDNGQAVEVGASFAAYFADENDKEVYVNMQVVEQHVGYQHYRLGNNIDKQATASGGGLLLTGGGYDGSDSEVAKKGYRHFLENANRGDIVVIAHKDHDIVGQADQFFKELGVTLDSVVAFSFDVQNGQLTQQALNAARDGNPNGNGPGREFLDALHGAEAIFFMGGNQWHYWRLFHDTFAADEITNNNINDRTAVGGTSAGMAILGEYVFSAQYIQGENDALQSGEILGNLHSADLIQNGRVSIETNMFGFSPMQGVITESHFTDSGLDNREFYWRLGRLLSFIAAIRYGLGQLDPNPGVRGVGVDSGTALWIDNDDDNAQVFGKGKVWFSSPLTPMIPYFDPTTFTWRIAAFAAGVKAFHAGETLHLDTAWSDGTPVLIVLGRLSVPKTLPFAPS